MLSSALGDKQKTTKKRQEHVIESEISKFKVKLDQNVWQKCQQ